MKKISISFGTILLVLGCFWGSSAAQAAGRPIVGLWIVHYVSNAGGPEALAYDQWHNDGLEFEVAGLFPGAVCQGTFKQAEDGTVHLYHVSWTFDSTGALSGYWEETQTNKVSANHETYSGTYDVKFYDLNGNFLFEDTGTQKAERLPEHY